MELSDREIGVCLVALENAYDEMKGGLEIADKFDYPIDRKKVMDSLNEVQSLRQKILDKYNLALEGA